jgi:hypothetical protein
LYLKCIKAEIEKHVNSWFSQWPIKSFHLLFQCEMDGHLFCSVKDQLQLHIMMTATSTWSSRQTLFLQHFQIKVRKHSLSPFWQVGDTDTKNQDIVIPFFTTFIHTLLLQKIVIRYHYSVFWLYKSPFKTFLSKEEKEKYSFRSIYRKKIPMQIFRKWSMLRRKLNKWERNGK